MDRPIIPDTPAIPQNHHALREIEHDQSDARNVEDVPAPPALNEA